MKFVVTVECDGQGMEEVHTFLRERGCTVTECGPEIPEALIFSQFAMDNACVQVFWLTHDQRIIYANNLACRSLGYTRDELLALSYLDITPAYTNEDWVDLLRKLEACGSLEGETLLRRKDGSTFPSEFLANKIDFHGTSYVVVFGRDSAERKKADEAIHQSEEKFKSLFMSLNEGCYLSELICDDNGNPSDYRFLDANPQFEQIMGLGRDQIIGKRYKELVPVDTTQWLDKYFKVALAGEPCTYEFYSEEYRMHFDTYAYQPAKGQVCVRVINVTERKKTEDALRESEKKFRLLTEISPNPIIVIRGERIAYANPAVTDFSGFTAEQLRGMEFLSFVHEDSQTVARERLLARQRGEPISSRQEYRIINSQNDEKWVIATSAVKDYEGTPAVFVTLVDITESKKTEEALRESEARLKLAMDMAKLAQWEFDTVTGMFHLNDQLYALYGTSTEQEGGTLMSAKSFFRKFTHPDDIPLIKELIVLSMASSSAATRQIEHRIVRADGEERHVSVRWEVLNDREGRCMKLRGANQDITERKRAEEERKNLEVQLHQAQKMEAVGQLAGGIAHDFNNILTAIIGYAEVMSMRMSQVDPLQYHVKQVLAAAKRAADLTQGLLVFSRKQILHVRAIDVQEVVNGVKNFLRWLIPEDIDLRVTSGMPGVTVMADRGQIEQVLMNLVTNARDAMPTGGLLTIETDPVVVDNDSCHGHGFGMSGKYARIAVQDTGCGVDKAMREKIFEPFFTTKGVGKGTGLGLSIIYGIVKQHNGFITVDSTPGQGTIFCVYLPLVEQEKQEQSVQQHIEPIPSGTETILLAEDDDMVRELTRMILEEAGYTVIEAADGREALDRFREYRSQVDILVTDVIMPGMDGRRLYEEIVAIRPEMKVLFVSGYSRNILKVRGGGNDDISCMQKPVMPSDLLKRVRKTLDGR